MTYNLSIKLYSTFTFLKAFSNLTFLPLPSLRMKKIQKNKIFLSPSGTAISDNKLCLQSSFGLEITTCPLLKLPLYLSILISEKDFALLLDSWRLYALPTSTQSFNPTAMNLLGRTQPSVAKHFLALIVSRVEKVWRKTCFFFFFSANFICTNRTDPLSFVFKIRLNGI